MLAAYLDYPEITQLLLAHPEILVNEKDSEGDTALMLVAKYHPGCYGFVYDHSRYQEIIQLLLARPEILVNEKSSHGLTALIWAAYHGNPEITQLLLARPEIQVNEKDSD